MLHEEHPLDKYFRELIRRRRRELLRRKRAALKAVQAVVAMSGLRRRLGLAAGEGPRLGVRVAVACLLPRQCGIHAPHAPSVRVRKPLHEPTKSLLDTSAVLL